MGQLTVEEMKRVIDEGGSVLVHKGTGKVLATKHEDLPTEAELAQGDPMKEAAAREHLDLAIATLQAQRDSLDKPAAVVHASRPERREAVKPPEDEVEVEPLHSHKPKGK